MQENHEIHWKADKMILHYVQGTKHFWIHYAASSPLELVGFTDSDWDGDSIDRNSNSSYVSCFQMIPYHGKLINNTLYPFHQLRLRSKEHECSYTMCVVVRHS